jgi:molybdenum cofactor cytidylyltransferase
MISAIVLAAGNSTRMGDKNKLLLPYGNSTVLATVISQLEQSLADEIIVVTNNDDHISKLYSNYKKPISFVKNENAEDGLTSSIQCGVKATNPQTRGFMICLGDMILLTKYDYNLLINKFLDKSKEVILLPNRSGKRGNPVIFSYHFLDQIMHLRSPNGCKPLVLSFPSYIIEVPVNNNHYFFDIDTQKDYETVNI